MDYLAYYKDIEKDAAVKMLEDMGFEIKKVHKYTTLIDVYLATSDVSELEDKILKLNKFNIEVRPSQQYSIPKGEELKKP